MAATAADPNFEARVRESFSRQGVMTMLGARMTRLEPGVVELTIAARPDLTQQNGFMHAGIVATVMDSACGYSAFSLMPAKGDALTVEYKINLLRPAAGKVIVARARVVKPGKTLTVAAADAFSIGDDGEEKLVATMLNTIMALPDR